MVSQDPGMVISDGDRVKHNDKNGTVLRVMSDGRARVKWDDGTETIVYSGNLTKISNPK